MPPDLGAIIAHYDNPKSLKNACYNLGEPLFPPTCLATWTTPLGLEQLKFSLEYYSYPLICRDELAENKGYRQRPETTSLQLWSLHLFQGHLPILMA